VLIEGFEMPRCLVSLLICYICQRTIVLGEEPIRYAPPVEISRLENKRVSESSGLAASRRDPDLFWTHNDSGDKPRIYCFRRNGKHVGTCKLTKAGAIDWEDMCSFEIDDKPKLLIGDLGDNLTRRKSYRLYLLDEPKNPSKDVKDIQVIRLRYSVGSMDCEAIGADVESRKLLFVEKKRWFNCRVFEADLPTTKDVTDIVAKPIGRINLPLVTAMDVSSDGRRAIVLTLGQAFEFTRGKGETWTKAFAKKPRTIDMPARKQGETICYGANGRDFYLTSEFTPTPLFLVEAISTPIKAD
jgi:hypothetical protein